MVSSLRSSSLLENTCSPSAWRSRLPSLVINLSPNVERIWARPGVLGATTSRASWSASITAAPRL